MLTASILDCRKSRNAQLFLPQKHTSIWISHLRSSRSRDSANHKHSLTARWTHFTLLEKLKDCYVLVCPASNCGQEMRSPSKRKFQCMNCKQENMLTPRYRFDVNLQNDTGSITGMIMGTEGEKLLSLSAEEIYALASTQSDEIRLNENWFNIQVKKSVARSSRTLSGKLLVLSCTQKESIIDSLPAPSTNNKRE